MKRVLILGDKGVGKTTFMNVFLDKQLPQIQQPTLGVEAGAKTIEFGDRSFVNLQVWDTPGQEEYAQMAYPFYANCKIFVLVLDRMRSQTLESLPQWLQKIQEHNPSRPKTVLVVLNKITRMGSNNEIFDKKTLQLTFHKQLQELQRRKFNITVVEIDLLEEQEHVNRSYMHPYLHDCLAEEIIMETEQKRVEKCGGINCKSEGCEVM